MNPFLVPTIATITIASMVVAACDEGRSRTPPANVVGHMMLAATSGTAANTIVGTMVVNTILNQVYDTTVSRHLDWLTTSSSY